MERDPAAGGGVSEASVRDSRGQLLGRVTLALHGRVEHDPVDRKRWVRHLADAMGKLLEHRGTP